ncbi:hypothetical protein P9112_006722 [Eukaryota sp. TZLM1-RC]
MRCLLFLCIFAAVAFCSEIEDRKLFGQFLREHKRLYASEEVEQRFRIFQGNLRTIEKLAEENPEARFGITEFADLTRDEFLASKTSIRPDAMPLSDVERRLPRVDYLQGASAPAHWSWVEQGRIPPIRNQGSCGSCWAFSAASSVETVASVQLGGPVYNLAPQEFVDCVSTAAGCNGGWMHLAFDWMLQTGTSLAQEAYYPYHAVQGGCYSHSVQGAVGIADYGFVSGSQSRHATDPDMQNAVYAYGSLGVAVDASAFQFYHGGVITNPNSCAGQINHAVNLVGYGFDNYHGDYWLVRNSWGQNWGENGYVRLSRNRNMCQINSYVIAACGKPGCY